MNKSCNKCGDKLEAGINITLGRLKNSDYVCSPCRKKIDRAYGIKNKDKLKKQNAQYYQKNKDKFKKYHLERYPRLKHQIIDNVNKFMAPRRSQYVYVYLLPKENYVGITRCLYNRMSVHKSYWKRDISNWEILNIFDSRTEALECESALHNLGYEGKGEYGKYK